MDCFNKFLWVYLVFWEQLHCQNAGVALSVAAKAARPAWKWLNEMCVSNVCHCKRVGSFVVQRFKEHVYYIIIIIIIISNLSNDRSKASSKTIPPHSAI